MPPNRPSSPGHRSIDPAVTEAQTRQLWRMAGMGWTLASEIAAGALIGWGLDWLFGTGRTLLIVGTIAGVLVGMVAFIRSAMQANRQAVEQAGPQTRRTVEDAAEPTESHDPE